MEMAERKEAMLKEAQRITQSQMRRPGHENNPHRVGDRAALSSYSLLL